MRVLLAIAAVALLATSAVAGDINSPDQHGLQNQNQGQAQGQLQLQGQQQGQGQGQIGINKNYNDVYNKNDNYNKNDIYSNNDNYNKNKNYNDNYSNSNSYSGSESESEANNEGNKFKSSVNVEGATTFVEGDNYPASSAYAANLIATKCWGSTGVGAQGMTFGFTVNSTWKDPTCITLRNAAAIAGKRDAKGGAIAKHMAAAHAIECMITEIREAYMLTGNPCPQDLKKVAAMRYFLDQNSGKVVWIRSSEVMPKGQVALQPLPEAPENVIWNNDDHKVALATEAE